MFGFLGELGFWAEFFDCLGSVLYMTGSFVLIFNFFNLISGLRIFSSPLVSGPSAPVSVNNGPTAPVADFDASFTLTDNTACRYFFFGDLTFAFDSVLYIIQWYRYHRAEVKTSDVDVDLGIGDKYLPIEDHNLERSRQK